MAAPYYLAIHGRLVVIGKEPDGNSVRFIADHPDAYAQLKHAHRIRVRPTRRHQGRRRRRGGPGGHLSRRPPSSTAARSPTWSPPSARTSTSPQTGSGCWSTGRSWTTPSTSCWCRRGGVPDRPRLDAGRSPGVPARPRGRDAQDRRGHLGRRHDRRVRPGGPGVDRAERAADPAEAVPAGDRLPGGGRRRLPGQPGGLAGGGVDQPVAGRERPGDRLRADRGSPERPAGPGQRHRPVPS